MKLFLICSSPLAGAILLSLVVPGWSGRKELFSAGGRAFLWFWLAQAISFFLSVSGLYGVTVVETLLQRWSGKELPHTLFFIAGIMLWRVPRKCEGDTESLIRSILIFTAISHLFNGAAEAIIHHNRYEPIILFAIPFAQIGGMLFAALGGLFFIGFSGRLRWLLFPITALAGSLLSVLPHAFYSENLNFSGIISAIIFPIVAISGLFLTLHYLFPREHPFPREQGLPELESGSGESVTTIVKQ